MKRINQWIAALISAAILLTGIGIGASVYYAHKSKETSIMERMNEDVHTLYDTQDNMETALTTLADCFSHTQNLSQESMIAIMNSLKTERDFSFVARTKTDGYAFNNEGKTDIYLGERDYFLKGMEGKTTTSFITQGIVDSTSGYLLTAVPIYKDGKPDGIVHGSYSTDNYLSKVVETTSEDTLILLLDMDGNILGIHGNTEVAGNIKNYLKTKKDLNGFLKNLSDGKRSSVDLMMAGVRTCAVYAPLKFDNSELFVMFATPTKSIPFSADGFWQAAGIMLSIDSVLVVILLLSAFALWRFQAQMEKNELEKKHLESLAAEQKMYQTIIDETANAIVVVDIKTHEVLYANAVALNLLTNESDTFIGVHCYTCIAHNDAPCEFCPIKDGVVIPQSRELVIKGRRYHQDFKPILWHGRKALVEYNRDVTQIWQLFEELKQQKEELEQLSTRDISTGLGNRNGYNLYVQNFNKQKISAMSAVYIDANGLHEMNNRYGHEVGDKMLRFIASQSQKIFPQGKIFRIGGDEFTIISESLTKKDIESKVRELLKRIKAEGYSIAYGIAFGQQNMGIEELIREADHRMLEDKRNYYSQNEHDRRKIR